MLQSHMFCQQEEVKKENLTPTERRRVEKGTKAEKATMEQTNKVGTRRARKALPSILVQTLRRTRGQPRVRCGGEMTGGSGVVMSYHAVGNGPRERAT